MTCQISKHQVCPLVPGCGIDYKSPPLPHVEVDWTQTQLKTESNHLFFSAKLLQKFEGCECTMQKWVLEQRQHATVQALVPRWCLFSKEPVAIHQILWHHLYSGWRWTIFMYSLYLPLKSFQLCSCTHLQAGPAIFQSWRPICFISFTLYYLVYHSDTIILLESQT